MLDSYFWMGTTVWVEVVLNLHPTQRKIEWICSALLYITVQKPIAGLTDPGAMKVLSV